MRPLLVLFDVDGTLLLTGGAGSRALTRAFELRFGVPDGFAGIRPHGRTDPRLLALMARRHLRRPLTPPEEAGFWRDYLGFLTEELAAGPGFRVLPGVRDLLEELAARPGVHLGLATGNLEAACRLKLRRAGLERFFAFGGYGSDAARRGALTAAALARGRRLAGNAAAPAVLVGDTPADMRAGRAVGALPVGVRTTGQRPARLRRAGAALVLPDLVRAGPLRRLLAALQEGV